MPFNSPSIFWWHRARDGQFRLCIRHSGTSPRLIVLATSPSSSRCFLSTSLPGMETSNELLRDMFDEIPCVLGWCVSIPMHPVFGASIPLRVIDRPTDRIFSWLGVVFIGLRRTTFYVQTFIRTSRGRWCVRGDTSSHGSAMVTLSMNAILSVSFTSIVNVGSRSLMIGNRLFLFCSNDLEGLLSGVPDRVILTAGGLST